MHSAQALAAPGVAAAPRCTRTARCDAAPSCARASCAPPARQQLRAARPPLQRAGASRGAASARRRACRGAVRLVAAAGAAEDYYKVLGVERNADAKALKSAYRKLALKFHPDVNKAPDATDRFRQIKAAYTTLSDPEARAQYDRRSQGGASSWGRSSGGASSGSSGGGGFDFDFGSYGRSKGSGPAEEFYGLGDFFRDLDKELSGSEKRAGGRTREKSLAEELAEIGMSVGEELIEFLEMGLAGLEDPAKSKSSGSGSSSTRSSSSSSAKPPPPPPPPRPAAPPPPPKAPLQSVDDMLAQMKKDMGL